MVRSGGAILGMCLCGTDLQSLGRDCCFGSCGHIPGDIHPATPCFHTVLPNDELGRTGRGASKCRILKSGGTAVVVLSWTVSSKHNLAAEPSSRRNVRVNLPGGHEASLLHPRRLARTRVGSNLPPEPEQPALNLLLRIVARVASLTDVLKGPVNHGACSILLAGRRADLGGVFCLQDRFPPPGQVAG